jgi:hemerythrin superfamily protein
VYAAETRPGSPPRFAARTGALSRRLTGRVHNAADAERAGPRRVTASTWSATSGFAAIATGIRRRPDPKGFTEMSTDAIVLLKQDHKEIRKLFDEFQQAGERATKRKGQLVERIVAALTVHTYIENECMYPEVRKLLPELEDDVLESYEEHHVADVLCMELATMSPDDERFDAKTTVLIENVRHHMDEEEQEWFPKVRGGLGRKQLQELGEHMLELKKKAPRKPAQPSALKKVVDAVVS